MTVITAARDWLSEHDTPRIGMTSAGQPGSIPLASAVVESTFWRCLGIVQLVSSNSDMIGPDKESGLDCLLSPFCRHDGCSLRR